MQYLKKMKRHQSKLLFKYDAEKMHAPLSAPSEGQNIWDAEKIHAVHNVKREGKKVKPFNRKTKRRIIQHKMQFESIPRQPIIFGEN